MNIKNRTLFIADNLDILRGINSDCIDLIYLDPPFNSKKKYKAPIGSPAEGAEFKDIWTDEDIKAEWHGEIAEENQELYQVIQASEVIYNKSMKIYLMAMAVRLFEIKRILKSTGSIYLHCDATASHYLKGVLDAIFGIDNFRNEIVWGYSNSGRPKRFFAKKHDIILLYTKTDKAFWGNYRIPISEEYLASHYRQVDDKGRRCRIRVDAGKRRYYYPEEGMTPNDWWKDIPSLNSVAKERTGWPTQKPLALLERIIKASSNEGDIILDPFCGCATACVAAEQLNRQWIGMDISPSAEDITKLRLEEIVDKESNLFSPFTDVIIQTQPPVRTDRIEQVPPHKQLPKAHTYKHEIYGKQEGKCVGCNYSIPFRNITIDHIVPISKGGTDQKENLQLLCNACNSTKGARSQSEFIAILKEQGVRTDATPRPEHRTQTEQRKLFQNEY